MELTVNYHCSQCGLSPKKVRHMEIFDAASFRRYFARSKSFFGRLCLALFATDSALHESFLLRTNVFGWWRRLRAACHSVGGFVSNAFFLARIFDTSCSSWPIRAINFHPSSPSQILALLYPRLADSPCSSTSNPMSFSNHTFFHFPRISTNTSLRGTPWSQFSQFYRCTNLSNAMVFYRW